MGSFATSRHSEYDYGFWETVRKWVTGGLLEWTVLHSILIVLYLLIIPLIPSIVLHSRTAEIKRQTA